MEGPSETNLVREVLPGVRAAAHADDRCGGGGCAHEERDALLKLLAAPGIGAVSFGLLRSRFGSARAALDADTAAWSATLRMAPHRAATALGAARAADPQPLLERAAARGMAVVTVVDASYPALLRASPDPPPALFLAGRLASIDDWAIAIVGSRRASAYGIDQASAFSRGLVEHGHTIVSGGARGIDAEAHRAALRAGGRTVAVLGSAIDEPYPPEHTRLFEEIVAAGGAIVSEHPPGVTARAEFFPRRNRIIAGMSLAVLLIEARARSGASITARIAVEDLGREALALPGRVDSLTSEGTHRAIREGWAALVTSTGDVIAHLRERGAPQHLIEGARCSGHPPSTSLFEEKTERSPVAAAIAALLADGRSRTTDMLVTGLAADHDGGAVLASITLLEVAGHLRRAPDGGWEARASLLAGLDAKRPRKEVSAGP
jgi:DNA processing protein